MDTRLSLLRLVAFLLAGTVALPAAPGVLYKAIGADGTIIFTDVPPPADARIVEQRRTPAAASTSPAVLDDDEAVARANDRVDLAEHAFALARQGLWSPADGLRMSAARRSRGDDERVSFYERDVRRARAQLLDLLRERQFASSSPYRLASR
ncbi:MAG: DUF4124 domain-containing protein [Usitatibacter sp.]